MDVGGDSRVLVFVALVAASACVIFGLLPAIRATATSPGAAMKAGSRGLEKLGWFNRLKNSARSCKLSCSVIFVFL